MIVTAATIPTCPYCGAMPHQGICPSVKAIEYYPDGSIKRVEMRGAEQSDFVLRNTPMTNSNLTK